MFSIMALLDGVVVFLDSFFMKQWFTQITVYCRKEEVSITIEDISEKYQDVENYWNYKPALRIYEKGAPVHMKEFSRITILNM